MTEPAFRIVFPHIAKTGGTTLLHHFRQRLGDDAVFVFGPTARARRLLSGEPQFEELDAEARARIRVVQGHGVDEDTLLALGARSDDRLLVVLRNPASFVRSRYNHRAKAVERRCGAMLSPQKFLARHDSDNAISRSLVSRFSCFVDPSAKDLTAQAISVLRHFHYVLTTEQMGPQVQATFARLGLGGTVEPRRVAEKRLELPISDDEIRKRNDADQALFERANVVLESDGTTHNPFGYDPAARAAALARRLAERPPQPHWHAELADALCKSLKAEAVLDWIASGAKGMALADPAAFKPVLEQAWADRLAFNSLEESQLSARKAARMRARIKRRKGNPIDRTSDQEAGGAPQKNRA